MLWGQRLKVFTDHKNLVRDALGMTSDRVYRWRLILEEYGPEIVYIKGEDNIVADAISRLEYDPEINVKKLYLHQRVICKLLTKSFRRCSETQHGGVPVKRSFAHMMRSRENNDLSVKNISSNIFAVTNVKEDDIYPPTIAEIAQAQRSSGDYKHYFKKSKLKKERLNG